MSSGQFEQYIKDCKKLKRDLEHAISDLYFKQEGGIIRYAVDFSEIYEYVLPDKEAKGFFLFLDESTDIAYLLQRRALNRLFWDSQEKLILLAPYTIELNTFLVQFHQNLFYEQLGKIPSILQEINKILDNHNFDKFQRITEVSISELSPGARSWLIEFLEQNANNLLIFLDEFQASQPSKLVEQLFKRERLESLENLVKTDFSLDSEIRDNKTTKRWYEALTSKPSKSSNMSSRLDAIAIAAIEKANQELPSQNTKLLLVTRSERMHTIFEQELQNNLWTESFLRHPRIFDILSKIEVVASDTNSQINWLEDKLKILDVFLNSSSQNDWDHIGDEQNNKFLQEKLIKEIQRDWRSKENIAAILEKPSTPPSQQLWEKYQEKIPAIKNFLKNPLEVRNLLLDKFKELMIEWERVHQSIGFNLQTVEKQDDLKEHLSIEKFSNKYVLKTISDKPFSVQFYSDEAKHFLGFFKRQESYSFVEIIETFNKELGKKSDYEILLAMACILGTLGQDKWKYAETFCEWSIKEANNPTLSKTSVLPHEGYFFLAICFRKFSSENSLECSFKRCLESIKHLNTAIKIKKKVPTLELVDDPRYLKEKGSQFLRLDVYFKEKINNFKNEFKKYFSPNSGLNYLEKALKLSSNDCELQKQIYNNLLFYFVEKKLLKDEKKLLKDDKELLEDEKKLLEELLEDEKELIQDKFIETEVLDDKEKLNNYSKELTKLLDTDESNWPPSVQDTLIMFRWLQGVKTEENNHKSIQKLQLLLDSDKPSSEERRVIERHIQKIKQTMQN